MPATTDFIATGTKIPDMTLTDQDGKPISLQDFAGQKVVLFFYPKDSSPSCTKEVCSLRDGYEVLREKGFEVLGVSPDSEASHQKFIEKQNLPYRLISDPDHELAEAFGAWGEKNMYGKTYMGLIRSTFLIDEAGTVSHVIDKVKTKDHAQQILDLLAS
jgi:thioredoxin-dependent peroxiredoxin